MITKWHYKVAKEYAKTHHGHVNELRKNKASISTVTGVEHLKYWQMEQWLLENGITVMVERTKPKPVKPWVNLRHRLLCMKARIASGGLL